eukprot:4016956-Prymnesium_polylepis.1
MRGPARDVYAAAPQGALLALRVIRGCLAAKSTVAVGQTGSLRRNREGVDHDRLGSKAARRERRIRQVERVTAVDRPPSATSILRIAARLKVATPPAVVVPLREAPLLLSGREDTAAGRRVVDHICRRGHRVARAQRAARMSHCGHRSEAARRGAWPEKPGLHAAGLSRAPGRLINSDLLFNEK